MSKITEVDDGKLGKEKKMTMGEIGNPGPIEPVSSNDFVKDMEIEAFMSQELLINVPISGIEGELPVICPSVNGINMPIVRGKDTKVKRKYVEALARTRIIRYDQEPSSDPFRPDKIKMVERPTLAYPFFVKYDPHPHGAEWLDSILATPA